MKNYKKRVEVWLVQRYDLRGMGVGAGALPVYFF